MIGLVKPSKILSIVPVFNRDPSSVGIDVLCSLCEEVDTLVVSYAPESDVLGCDGMTSILFAVVIGNGNPISPAARTFSRECPVPSGCDDRLGIRPRPA
jgi:hypothetical protein